MELFNVNKPMNNIIELGGGERPQFHPNYDCRNLPNVDYIIDFNKPLPLSSNTYDGVFSRYSIEHISWRNVKQFLTEIYRILKPDGAVVLITANLLEQARVLVNTSKWEDKLICMIFGDQDYIENSHKCGFSPEYITNILEQIGFSKIEIMPIYSEVGPTDMIIRANK